MSADVLQPSRGPDRPASFRPRTPGEPGTDGDLTARARRLSPEPPRPRASRPVCSPCRATRPRSLRVGKATGGRDARSSLPCRRRRRESKSADLISVGQPEDFGGRVCACKQDPQEGAPPHRRGRHRRLPFDPAMAPAPVSLTVKIRALPAPVLNPTRPPSSRPWSRTSPGKRRVRSTDPRVRDYVPPGPRAPGLGGFASVFFSGTSGRRCFHMR